MQISVTGKQLDMGAALREHIVDALNDIVEKYFDKAIDASVVMSHEKHRFRADLAVHVGRGIMVRARDEADDAYAAFDLAAVHLGKRLRRHKRRLRHHHAREASGPAEVAMSYVLAAPGPETGTASEDETTTADHPVVIAEDDARIEQLTVSEAVMRMDLADLPALMFRNAAHDRLNVIYRRPDGNIGWIDPHRT